MFVDDIAAAKIFYRKVFAPEIVYEDDVSAVLKFAGVMVPSGDVWEVAQELR